MAKQLNVNLAFSADTTKAKAQLQDLQRQLDGLLKNTPTATNFAITDELVKAQGAAASLKVALDQSMNVKTGKLDLTRFNDSIKKSGLSLTDLKLSLEKLGPTGASTFMSLSKSIMSAEVPLRRTSALFDSLWTTMKNTARWQLSSSVLHGFVGAVQSAYGYAKDLDESLNNIRIVTGYNVEEMSKFAEQANKAAKALSTTTTNYTNASLIYYQQGLSAQEVQKRTDITIKMANAAGQSAEEVSDQLTAVWNNFYDGTKSLEYYADVMTALGAATASSTDEIAGGLEKFAAIGETIGLSYEYAAAALATITANTRQSEDVVGTALKTIFARIQGLNLGETLDDGTTLNKYSEALNKVGISIFEQNGELKNMDNILNEMGAKWSTLDKAQQTALAQTVAGVRQYTQLISLMDNWDAGDSDSMMANLETAYGSTGTLQEQADIYAESWQAAGDRVKASLEDIYDSVIDEEIFIGLLNGLEDILNIIGTLADSMGGLPGIISLIGVALTKAFSPQLTQMVENMIFGIKSLTGSNASEAKATKQQAFNIASSMNYDDGTRHGAAVNAGLKDQLKLQDTLLKNEENLSAEELKRLQTLMDINAEYAEAAAKAAAAEDKARDELGETSKNLRAKVIRSAGDDPKARKQALQEYQARRSKMTETLTTGNNAQNTLATIAKGYAEGTVDVAQAGEFNKQLDSTITTLKGMGQLNTAEELQKLRTGFQNGTTSAQDFSKGLNKIVQSGDIVNDTIIHASDQFRNEYPGAVEFTEKEIDELANKDMQLVQATYEADVAMDAQAKHTEAVAEAMNSAKKAAGSAAAEIVKFASGVSQFMMGVNSIKSAIDTINNQDMDFGEKFLSVAMSLSMGLPMIINGITSLLSVKYASIAADIKTIAVNGAVALSHSKLAKVLVTETVLMKSFDAATGKATFSLLGFAAASGVIIVAAAAIAGLTYALIKANEAYNADARAAERAAQAADALAEASDKAKQELEELESAVDAYDTAYEALEQCKEGTDEWREALEKVNNETWDLLEKFPDLLKMANLFNEDGTLNRDAIEAYIKNQEDKANNAQSAAVSAQMHAEQARVKSDKTDLGRRIGNMAEQYGYSGDMALSAGYENQGKNLVEDLVAKIQADPTYADGDLQKDLAQYASTFDILEENQDAFAAELVTVAEDLISLANASDSAQSAMERLGQIVAGEVLGDNATNDQKEKYGEEYNKEYNKKYDEIYAELTGSKVSRTSSKSDVADLWQQYQEATGTNYHLASNAVIGNDENRSFQYIDENGDPKQITAEAIAEAIASAAAKTGAEAVVRDDIVDQFALGEGENAQTVINKDVGTELINTLAQSVDMKDEETVNALTSLLAAHSDSAAEQRRLIEEFINNSQTEEQKEENEVNSLISNASSNYELDPELIEAQAKNLEELYEAEGLTRVEATKLAIENQRMNKGVESLIDNWDDWNKELKAGQLDKSKKGTAQYAKTIKDLTKTIADLTGASSDLELPSEFFESEENLKLIGEAATGSEKAINALGLEVAKTGIEMAEQIDYAVKGADGNYIDFISTSEFETAKSTVLSGLSELQSQVLAGNDLIGQSLDTILSASGQSAENWVASMNEMALATNMSVDEMNSKLSEMGLEADVTVTEVETTSRKPITRTQMSNIVTDPETNQITSYDMTTSTVGYENVPEIIQVAQIATNGEDPGSPPVKYIGNGSVSPTTTGKKDSGNSGKKTKPKRSDTVKRYKEVDDKLDNISKEMSKVNREMNQLYGSARISKMKENISLMEDEVDILKAKREEAEAYKKVDKNLLEQAAKDAGVTFEFNADGTIKNYTEQMNLLHDRLEQAFNAGNTVLQEQIQQQISDLEAAISAYDDTLNTIEDLDEQIADNLDKIMRENYNVLTYKLELELELNDSELQKIEFELGLIADDFYKMAEAASLMMSQMGPYKDSLGDLANHYNDLNKAFADGKITQEDYINGLKEARDGIYDQLNALVELDKEMMEYYGNTLDAAMEELDKYTSHMEHLTGVIDHYMSLMELMGKSEDYEAMGSFLEARAKTTKNELDVAKSNYDMLLKQKAQIEERMAGVEEGSAAWELYKKEWDAIVAATDEAQEEMLSKTEEWMEAMKAVIENNMKKAQKALEESLTGGTDFDTLMTEMDRLNARQEEYLTKTNQIYETNKLMRQAAQAADKTDNAVAKQKFKNFAEETKQLQEKGQLSKYELEIQQAKYDLLLAEIALEDAQNAKSTVRLQRDSEGNFGYVYTADQDQIANAQQAVEDAKNDLYNISLEGQQTYSEKYVQGLQQMNDEIAQLEADWLAGRITSQEEFEAKREAIEQHYFGVPDGILTTYSNLYNVAVQTDAQATADFWGKSYGAMTQNTEDFHTAVTTHFEAIDADMEKWEDITTTAQENITEGLDDLIEESDDYADTVNDEVIPAIEDELEAVEDLTAGYADQRAEVKRLIEEYKALVVAINAAIAAAARQSGSGGSGDYSRDMINAKEAGDEAGYNAATAGRKNKETSNPNSTSVSTDRVGNVIDAAYDPTHPKHQQAKDLVDDIKAGEKKFTNDTVTAAGFRTGGYTGEWGPEGKLAFLHQKELILNKDDTSNFLAAIQIVRGIVDFIDQQAHWASAGIGLMSATGVQDYNQTLEQMVEIKAEFPNATNHSEIEEAFHNLMNTASQYANRKNR